jgi:hypothetical protein
MLRPVGSGDRAENVVGRDRGATVRCQVETTIGLADLGVTGLWLLLEWAAVRPRDPHHGRTDLGIAGCPDGGGLSIGWGR